LIDGISFLNNPNNPEATSSAARDLTADSSPRWRRAAEDLILLLTTTCQENGSYL